MLFDIEMFQKKNGKHECICSKTPPPPTQTEYYTISTVDKSSRHYAKIEDFSEDGQGHYVVYVGDKSTCIVCTVLNYDTNDRYETEMEMYYFDENEDMYICYADHAQTYALSMIAMSFVRERFGVQTFHVREDTYMQMQEGRTIPSIDWFLVVEGKTWYEKAYGAVPKYQEYVDKYRAGVGRLMEYVTSPSKKPSWDVFVKQHHLSEGRQIQLKDYYESSETIRDFFLKLPSIALLHRWSCSVRHTEHMNLFMVNDWKIECTPDKNIVPITYDPLSTEDATSLGLQFYSDTDMVWGRMVVGCQGCLDSDSDSDEI